MSRFVRKVKTATVMSQETKSQITKTQDVTTQETKTQDIAADDCTVANEMEKLKCDFKTGVAKEQASKWIDQTLDKGVAALQIEMDNLNKSSKKVKSVAFDANEDRNFAQDVICQDEQRVILKDEENNYIHANYVNTPNTEKRFICTQRPLETTVESFYKMVVQEDVEYIVMLCCFTENTMKKCPVYLPQAPTEQPMTFGAITVTCTHANEMKDEANVMITTLEIKKAGEKEHVMKHYHWKSWPERGFPDPTLTVFKVMCAVRNSKKPIVVHCSDGVGRSGVFVTIEYMVQKLQRGESCIDVLDLVKQIRSQRAMAVKTASHYIVLHRLLLQFFQEINIVDMSQRLLEFIDDYDTFTRKHKDEE